MITTKIQWTDSTINPGMGCDGCELWPSYSEVTKRVTKIVVNYSISPKRAVLSAMEEIKGMAYPIRKELIKSAATLIEDKADRKTATVEMKSIVKCYAGILTENRGGKIKGYPQTFDTPEVFPGRVQQIAKSKSLKGLIRENGPWKGTLPRMIFVSDMGDALSKGISFEFLRDEVVLPISTELGQRHIWQWLTKRPTRMAALARWLDKQGIPWPKNLVAMTTVTSQKTVGRAKQLVNVPAVCRGLSVEPMFGPVKLDLTGIHWVIAGGESGVGATPCELEWIRDLRKQCHKADVAFFVKQLGANPVENNHPLCLKNKHGGDWSEWPVDLRIREFPKAFRYLA